MRKILRKCKIILSAIMMLTCIVGLTGCAEMESITIDDITIINQSKTEITDFDCTIVAKQTTTKSEKHTSYSYGHSYSSKGGYGRVSVPSTYTEVVKDYYIVVKDADSNYARFQIDELDWQLFEAGDTITLQRVQQYGINGKMLAPFIEYKKEKLRNFEQLSKSEGKVIEERLGKEMEGDEENEE